MRPIKVNTDMKGIPPEKENPTNTNINMSA